MTSNVPAKAYTFKVVLLGEGCVGKTSVMVRYVEDKFNERHVSTLQVDIAHILEGIPHLLG
jgi:GTPase SAR1 family protein